jgi:AAA+ ATPase superfamily predicted ATPase
MRNIGLYLGDGIVDKPAGMFDRDAEWGALRRYVLDDEPGATLGVVSGRHRQGKTFLLDAACAATGGFYFGATAAADGESLRRLSSSLTAHVRPPSPIHLKDWYEAVDALLALGSDRPTPVVIDEFPHLADARPELPSIIQQALRTPRPERAASQARLLLCGSAMSFMGRLLAGHSPLRGRASLELVVRPLDFRLAAQFWDITDPRLAVQVYAVVGGTPAYRREYVRGDAPRDVDDFDPWVVRTVLNPETPLFREARYLLAEELEVRDPGLYHSVLAAVADGNVTRGAIANYLQRKSSDIGHPIIVLEDAGLLAKETDMFRDNRSRYRITEPLIAFCHAVSRPAWSQLERPGAAGRVWRASRHTFDSRVLGPRFEEICRYWTLHMADPELFGGVPSQVGSGVVHDPRQRGSHEVDVVVTGPPDGGRTRLLAIGEAKWDRRMGIGQLERLRELRTLIVGMGKYDTSATRLLCYSGRGFSDELRAVADDSPDDVALIGLDRLYAD